MSISDLFDYVFICKGVDPLVDRLLLKWEESLDDTLYRITSTGEKQAVQNLSILVEVLKKSKSLTDGDSCSRRN